MESWTPQDVLNYWKKSYGHHLKNGWNQDWDEKFLEHPEMKLIISVDASWIIEAMDTFMKLNSVANLIRRKLLLENQKQNDSRKWSGLDDLADS